jgi:hypothetical protein
MSKAIHPRVLQRMFVQGYGSPIMTRRFNRAIDRGDKTRKSHRHMVVLWPEGWVVLEGSGLIHKGRKP